MRSGSAMIEPTRFRGLSDAYGSWNTICISRRIGRRSRRERCEMSRPSNSIFPSVSSCRRTMQRPSVDLPQPGLADQPERLARADVERDVVDGVHAGDLALDDDALLDREVLAHALGAKQRLAVGAHADSVWSSGWIVALAPAALRLGVEEAGVEVAVPQAVLERRAPRGSARTGAGSAAPKPQPSGRLISDGGVPWIAVSRSGFGRSSRGIEPSSPHVYGCWAS